MDLKSGIDKFGLNPEDINDLYDEDKAAEIPSAVSCSIKPLPPGMLRWQLLFRQRMKRILFLQRI